MRILHTADWHLGIKLHKKDLSEDHVHFFEWLLTLLQEREIDVLIISGDIFDQSNPTNESRQLYYSFLKKLITLKCKVIITGGNHDSPGILNAPREILEMLDVHVVGNARLEISEEIIELKENDSKITAVICAVPYLRDTDIRQATSGETYENRVEQTRVGLKNHYDSLSQTCEKRYLKNIPIIAMGHLFATGSSTSESEREIQIGNLADFNSNLFPEGFSYIALGHIHRPQKIAGKEFVRYSGSPIQLSFSEKDDRKIVIEIELKNEEPLSFTDHYTPISRVLKKFSGSLNTISKELRAFRNPGKLKAFAELDISEESNDPIIFTKINELLGDFQSEEIEVLKYKLNINNQVSNSFEIFDVTTNIEDLNPLDVLKKRLEIETVGEDQKALILEAFNELIQSVQENL